MEKIREYYEYSKTTPSDINEHLPTLLKYSEECKHITEMGVRGGVSSWAFLYSNPEKMVAYDIMTNHSVENIINVANESNLNFHFILKDVLTVEIDTAIPEFLIGDKLRLSQIIMNLVSNALKFTKNGEVAVFANLKNVVDKTYFIEFQVKDTGIGIAKEDQEKIFEKFVKFDKIIQ